MGEPLLRIESVSKTFPGQKALDGVSLDVQAGEIHALVGHNGSGKSTLIKVLAGFHVADRGAIATFAGHPLALDRHRSLNPKMHFVHQGLGLVESLNAVDNIALGTGYIKRSSGRIHWSRQAELTREVLARVGVEINVSCAVSQLAPVERTAIAIARALKGWVGSGGLLVLDEPTVALPPREVDRLFEILHELRRGGLAIIYVSHRLDEIFRVADRVTVLRGGRQIATKPIEGVDRSTLIALMVGDDLHREHTRAERDLTRQNNVLEVRDLRSTNLRGISFDVHEGEVLGIAGIVGSGREELPYALIGTTRASGSIRLHGRSIEKRSPRRLRDLGVGLVPGDRARQGAVLGFDIRENMTLPSLHSHRRGPFVSQQSERRFAGRWAEDLDVRPRQLDRPIRTLSGGNQQKVMLAKWLGRSPDVLILDEPTAGVDVSTRGTIYNLIQMRATTKTSFVVSTSDLEDLVALCNRVLVLDSGTIVEELTGSEITEPRILGAMHGTIGREDHGTT